MRLVSCLVDGRAERSLATSYPAVHGVVKEAASSLYVNFAWPCSESPICTAVSDRKSHTMAGILGLFKLMLVELICSIICATLSKARSLVHVHFAANTDATASQEALVKVLSCPCRGHVLP